MTHSCATLHWTIHERTRRLNGAHTANDAVDVIDCARGAFVQSIGGFPGVAGVLVDEDRDLAFTSNRAEGQPGSRMRLPWDVKSDQLHGTAAR